MALFFNGIASICKFCARLLGNGNDLLFNPDFRISQYNLNGVITYFDPSNEAWFDDIENQYRNSAVHMNLYNICQTPRFEWVNKRKVRLLDGRNTETSVLRLENANVAMLLIMKQYRNI